MILLYYFIITVLLIGGMFLVRRRVVINILMLLFLGVQVTLCASAFLYPDSPQLGFFIFDATGTLFLSLLTLVSLTTVIHGYVNLRSDSTRRYQYYHMSLAGLIASVTGAILANNMTVVWIFVEATTLTASVLIYHEKNRFTLEAAWKYIFVCSVGIALAYFGILFLGLGMRGGAAFTMTFSEMGALLQHTDPLYLKVSFLFVLIGYSTKMELFPMHTAGVDANSVAHPQIAAFISTAMVNLGFVAFFRVYRMMWETSILPWMNNILILTGILSVLVAAGYMLKARHAKRMLAYSTLELMGIVAIALGVGGFGMTAAFLILVAHTLIKAGMFYQLSQLFRTMHTYMIKESGQYFRLNPAGALILLTGTFLVLAIPPSGLFWPELLVFISLAREGYWAVLLIVLFLLCFVVYAFATRIMHMLFSPAIEGHPAPVSLKPCYHENIIQWLMLLASMVLCFYRPDFLNDLIARALQP